MKTFEELLHDNCFARDEACKQAAADELESRFNAQISVMELDASLTFAHHARGCTIVAAKIGASVTIFQNVTIADGAKIYGPIVIGRDSFIAAGALVTKNVPARSTVTGLNQIRPKNPDYDYIFHQPMISAEETIASNEKLIAKFKGAN